MLSERTLPPQSGRELGAGYAQAEVMDDILKKACDNKDLSREGIVKASRQLSGVDTGGVIAGPLPADVTSRWSKILSGGRAVAEVLAAPNSGRSVLSARVRADSTSGYDVGRTRGAAGA